jgi:hypothetical protein
LVHHLLNCQFLMSDATIRQPKGGEQHNVVTPATSNQGAQR